MARVRDLAVALVAVATVFVLPSAAALASSGGEAGIGVVDPSTGRWYLQDPATGATTSFYYGNPGDYPFTGDWDCDGVDTPGLYRQSDGYVYLRNSNTVGIADVSFFFGNPGDVPVAGDFDGDGCDTVSIYRPAESRFYLINRLGSGSAGLGAADAFFTFGDRGDEALAGDWDGDGIDTPAVFRPATQEIHVLRGGSFSFGAPGDSVVVGAWTGGADDVAAHRPGDGAFHRRDGVRIPYGNSGLLPIAGSFGALSGGHEPPPEQPPYPNVGSGKRIIYSNSEQRVWLIEADGTLAKTHLVSGRNGVPAAGTYAVYSKSVNAWSYDGITMTHMVRFAHGVRLPYGFHSIPKASDGTPLQTLDQLGTFRSGGCVRQAMPDAVFLYDWAPIGTTVHVIP